MTSSHQRDARQTIALSVQNLTRTGTRHGLCSVVLLCFWCFVQAIQPARCDGRNVVELSRQRQTDRTGTRCSVQRLEAGRHPFGAMRESRHLLPIQSRENCENWVPGNSPRSRANGSRPRVFERESQECAPCVSGLLPQIPRGAEASCSMGPAFAALGFLLVFFNVFVLHVSFAQRKVWANSQ